MTIRTIFILVLFLSIPASLFLPPALNASPLQVEEGILLMLLPFFLFVFWKLREAQTETSLSVFSPLPKKD